MPGTEASPLYCKFHNITGWSCAHQWCHSVVCVHLVSVWYLPRCHCIIGLLKLSKQRNPTCQIPARRDQRKAPWKSKQPIGLLKRNWGGSDMIRMILSFTPKLASTLLPPINESTIHGFKKAYVYSQCNSTGLICWTFSPQLWDKIWSACKMSIYKL